MSLLHKNSPVNNLNNQHQGAWVVQSGKHPTLVQVMISWFMSSNPTLAARSPLWILSLHVSAPPPLVFFISLKNK